MEHSDRPPADRTRTAQANELELAAEIKVLRQMVERLAAEQEQLRAALARLSEPERAQPDDAEEATRPAADEALTARELEVLRLVASGLSDQAVAERLLLSPRTVNAHLRSIYARLGVRSRSAMTRAAIERGLI